MTGGVAVGNVHHSAVPVVVPVTSPRKSAASISVPSTASSCSVRIKQTTTTTTTNRFLLLLFLLLFVLVVVVVVVVVQQLHNNNNNNNTRRFSLNKVKNVLTG